MTNYLGCNCCTRCWQGTYINNVCSHCHFPRENSAESRTGTIPRLTRLETSNCRYIVGDVLGQGGFGITYSVWDEVNQRRLAMKEFFPTSSATRVPNSLQVAILPDIGEEGRNERDFRGFEDRFQGEFTLLTDLKAAVLKNATHPISHIGIVEAYDLFQLNGTSYYTMEYLDGADLRSIIRKTGPFTWKSLAPIVDQVLQILSRLHDLNLIHRDISPDNLFLTREGKMYLIDFGSARIYKGNNRFTILLKDSFSPWEQQISTGRQGPWTDIYALSATIYYLLSGKVPKSSNMEKQITEAEPLDNLCQGVPEYVCAAITKGMSYQIEDRFASAREMRNVLFHQNEPAPAPPIRPAEDARPAPHTPKKMVTYWLQGKSGTYEGMQRQLTQGVRITVGRSRNAVIRFPDRTVGVSRNQCVILIDADGTFFVRDADSRFGSYLNGVRLNNIWQQAVPGSVLSFGNEEFYLLSR